MENTQKVQSELRKKFSFIEGKIVIPRERRIFIEIPKESLPDVLQFIKTSLDFDFICAITGLDIDDHYQLIYHFADKSGIVLNIKVNLPKTDSRIDSITGIYNGAVFYERELVDMFGIQVEGLPEGRHYPLPDGWPEGQYPLRKDWKGFDAPKPEKEEVQ
jgi:membrane-bound hydrogenase subunit beta